ncbi:MAG TPA: signal peptide peptidase SppA [Terriglobales bacterium]|nr:signal peptide peptidase SppA [Terriglobales bacterium]
MLFLIMVVVVVGGLLLRSRASTVRIKTGSYLLLDVRDRYVEAPPDDLLGRLLGGGGRTLHDLITTLRMAKADQRIAGVILRIGSLDIGWAKAQDIRDAIFDFRRSNKPMLALLEHELTSSNREYYIATAADRIYLAPVVSAPLTGLAAQFLFLGGVWDKLDIEMTVEKIREYKTMGDMIGFKEMTPAHREMANALLDSLDAQFVQAVADARKLEPAQVREWIDRAPSSPREFESAGLSDGTKYVQTLHDEQGGEQTPLLRGEDYEEVDPADLGIGKGPKIAVVYAVGTIETGEGNTGIQGQAIGSDIISKAIQEAADDSEIQAIVLRVDSPGGSALASDLIWRATRYARAKKPVVVSMSDVAASGGYYISAGANKIVAQPGTLTGSIGVVMVRPDIKKALARLGVTTETLTRGKYAYLDDVTMPLTPDGRAKIVAGLEHIYAEFVDRVAAGRQMTTQEVDSVGRGRVWTGAQAKEKRLVDELGGFQRAVEIANELTGRDPSTEVELVFYPQSEGLAAQLSRLLGASQPAVQLPAPLDRIADLVVSRFQGGTLLTMMPESIEIR